VPIYDDRLLFEFLILEGMQAGLSWLTILKKRKAFKRAFDNFQAKKIIHYDQKKIKELLQNEKIIRNRLKINAVIANANAYLALKAEHGSFSQYLWQFVEAKPLQNKWRSGKQVPARTAISDAMAKALKKRGFKFVGSTICYAFMQAVGMVNDHTLDCFRHKKLT
jgi:DNA-3-methyladenine glycosylase I